MTDKIIEAVTQAICKSGKFETGEGTCAFVCMDQLGDARRGPCSHAFGIHNNSEYTISWLMILLLPI